MVGAWTKWFAADSQFFLIGFILDLQRIKAYSSTIPSDFSSSMGEKLTDQNIFKPVNFSDSAILDQKRSWWDKSLSDGLSFDHVPITCSITLSILAHWVIHWAAISRHRGRSRATDRVFWTALVVLTASRFRMRATQLFIKCFAFKSQGAWKRTLLLFKIINKIDRLLTLKCKKKWVCQWLHNARGRINLALKCHCEVFISKLI